MQLEDFSHKKILLLQGPVGPFFQNLALDLKKYQAEVIKINFNGGDEFFYKSGLAYTGNLQDFPSYLRELVIKYQIDTIMLFGDCRPIHEAAKATLSGFPIEWYVFEEGYLRPNHITCEKDGVNGYSSFPFQVKALLNRTEKVNLYDEPVLEVGSTFRAACCWAMLYYIAAHLGQWKYKRYQHHRPLTILEAWPWIKGAVRKYKYRWQERHIEKYLQQHKKQYFFVPLQTYNDAQITHHSPYACVEEFIAEVMYSFARHAEKDKLLVIKQHPFDRGYRDYTQYIQQLSQQYQIWERVFYIHDQYLPTLLDNSAGVVVVNSTVGMTAVESLLPVKVCGQAIYNLPQITAQCSLDDFWHHALDWQADQHLVQNYVTYLRHSTQFNGSFYRKLMGTNHHSGIVWNKQLDVKLNLQYDFEEIVLELKSKA